LSRSFLAPNMASIDAESNAYIRTRASSEPSSHGRSPHGPLQKQSGEV
jgi:hypothetical protein